MHLILCHEVNDILADPVEAMNASESLEGGQSVMKREVSTPNTREMVRQSFISSQS